MLARRIVTRARARDYGSGFEVDRPAVRATAPSERKNLGGQYGKSPAGRVAEVSRLRPSAPSAREHGLKGDSTLFTDDNRFLKVKWQNLRMQDAGDQPWRAWNGFRGPRCYPRQSAACREATERTPSSDLLQDVAAVTPSVVSEPNGPLRSLCLMFPNASRETGMRLPMPPSAALLATHRLQARYPPLSSRMLATLASHRRWTRMKARPMACSISRSDRLTSKRPRAE